MMLSAVTRSCTLQCVSVRVREQLSAVGEDILCVLERRQQQQQPRCAANDDQHALNVRAFVLERLGAAAECICSLFQREMDALRTLMDAHHVKDPHFDVPQLPVCKHELPSEHGEERSSSVVHEEPEPPHMMTEEHRELLHRPEEPEPPHMMTEEHRELLHRPEEAEPPHMMTEEHRELLHRPEEAEDDGSTLADWKARSDSLSDLLPVCKEESSPEQQEKSPGIAFPEDPRPLRIKEEPEEPSACAEAANGSASAFPAVKSEDGGGGSAETEPLASTSTTFMTTQADAQDRGASRPTSDDQLLSSHCSESDTEDSDEWDAGEDRSPLKAHGKTRNAGARTLSSTKSLSQDPKSSSTSPSRRSRTGKKTISCEVCGKTFSRNEHLNRHMKTHTGEKPFSCTVCGKAWGEKGDLTKHMRIHTGEKPFSCPFCCKGFGQVCDLKKHIRAHTGEKPYVCTVCGKGCSQMGDLKKHMMTHTGERPFDCAVCGKNFYLNQHLKRHMKIHEREKPSR